MCVGSFRVHGTNVGKKIEIRVLLRSNEKLNYFHAEWMGKMGGMGRDGQDGQDGQNGHCRNTHIL